MTREKFIKKWLGNNYYQYTEQNRDLMRDDLDEVINQALRQPPVDNTVLPAVVSDMDIETAAVKAYKGKDLNEQRANIDKILAFENGAKWALSKLSNNGS